MTALRPGGWRHPAVGPQRRRVLRLPTRAGTTVTLPSRAGWDTYCYVFEGAVGLGGAAVGYTESALVTGDGDIPVTATEDALVVTFCLDPDAPITRQGTVGR